MKKIVLKLSILVLLFSLVSCSRITHDYSARKGILDLSKVETFDSIIDLKGEFAFFWEKMPTEDELSNYNDSTAEDFMNVPGFWDPHKKGYGTYYLKIILPENHPKNLALSLNNILENCRTFANGKEIYSIGVPGVTPETSLWNYESEVISLPSDSNEIELHIQVSVWKHHIGGFSHNIYFGDRKILDTFKERNIILDSIIIGAMLLIGFYNIIMFFCLLKDEDREGFPYLFLGLIFFLGVLLVGNKNEIIFKTCFDWFTYFWGMKSIFSAMVLTLPLLYCYVYSFFPEYFKSITYRIVFTAFIIVWLVILTTPTEVFVEVLLPIEIFAIIFFLEVPVRFIYFLIRDKNLLIWAYFVGCVLLVFAVVSNMLENYLFLPAWVSSVLFCLFAFYQTFIQGFVTSKSYLKVKHLNSVFIEVEKKAEKLQDLSYVDQLTNVSNRRYFDEHIKMLWEKNSVTGVNIGLIVIDVDYFKLYNDAYGHLAGDECLIRVAAALRATMNRKGDFLARYGGEEFVVVVPQCNNCNIELFAERLCAAVRALEIEHKESKCSDYVTISLGTAIASPSKEKDWYKLFEKADDALYSAKMHGRNRVESF
ncbi:MAG: diguanylate cyclase [Spirochaetales bacterium]|nr:diguanylate cyclase [Spirochaetales bacterium]